MDEKLKTYLEIKGWKENGITQFLYRRKMSPATFARITGLSQSNLSNLCRRSDYELSTTAKAFVKILDVLHKLDLEYVLKEI